MPIPQFLVPTDFSAHADAALDAALNLANKFKARLILLHVRDDTALNPMSYTAAGEAEARHALEACLTRVQDAGVDGEVALVHGVPWREIVAMARDRQTDLVIMGTHGRTGLAHVLMGSVAERVVRQGPCPVLVSRQSEDAPPS
jgi:nucleotide-binding universal stress UspA family protein